MINRSRIFDPRGSPRIFWTELADTALHVGQWGGRPTRHPWSISLKLRSHTGFLTGLRKGLSWLSVRVKRMSAQPANLPYYTSHSNCLQSRVFMEIQCKRCSGPVEHVGRQWGQGSAWRRTYCLLCPITAWSRTFFDHRMGKREGRESEKSNRLPAMIAWTKRLRVC